MKLQKPTLTGDMLKGLGSEEARMRAVYAFFDKQLPVENSLLEETADYYSKNDSEKAARLYRKLGKDELANNIYLGKSIECEEKGETYDAINYAKWAGDKERERKLQMNVVNKSIENGDFCYAAQKAKDFGLYEIAIENYILGDLKRNSSEGISDAAEIAKNIGEGSYWELFIQKCKETQNEGIMRAAAETLVETGKCPEALEFYKILRDDDNIIRIAEALGQSDLALNTILETHDYGWAENYVERNEIEDKLPQVYKHAFNYYQEKRDLSTAAEFAEKLGWLNDAIDLYDRAKEFGNAARVARENKDIMAETRYLKKRLKKLKELGNHKGALEVGKELGLNGGNLDRLKKAAMDYHEKHFEIQEALQLAQELRMTEKVQTYATLLFLTDRRN